jgi:hypothetical protein
VKNSLVFCFPIADAELGPAGNLVLAGFLTVLASGTLFSGLHPRLRITAKWRGDLDRSAFGSLSFSVGLLTMAGAMVVRTVLHQQGPLAGIVLWLCCAGAILVVSGPGYDLARGVRKH